MNSRRLGYVVRFGEKRIAHRESVMITLRYILRKMMRMRSGWNRLRIMSSGVLPSAELSGSTTRDLVHFYYYT
jgi:hypothetical protein